jgi:hypothetical protein
VDNVLFPYILSINNPLFEIQSCTFSKVKAKISKDGSKFKSKEGAGRVQILNQFGITRAYTIEANYNMCNKTNKPDYAEGKLDTNKAHFYANGTGEVNKLVPDIGNLCRNFSFETVPAQIFFRIEDYQNIGKDVGIGLLDLVNLNPRSKLTNTPLKNLRVSKIFF